MVGPVSGLGQQIGDVLEFMNHGASNMRDIRDKLKFVYGDETYKEDIANMDDAEIVELAGNLKKGCRSGPRFLTVHTSATFGNARQGKCECLRPGQTL